LYFPGGWLAGYLVLRVSHELRIEGANSSTPSPLELKLDTQVLPLVEVDARMGFEVSSVAAQHGVGCSVAAWHFRVRGEKRMCYGGDSGGDRVGRLVL
jgi:hypothetical protein